MTTMKILFAVVISVSLSGCMTFCSRDDLVAFEKGGIHAGGKPYSLDQGGFRLDSIEIDLTKANREFLNDIWVELRCGEKTKLSELTPQSWRERYSSDCRFSFDFDPKGRVIKLSTNVGRSGSFCDAPGAAENPRMGSFSSGKSVALPSSVPEFESVFGKPDKMYSYHVN